MRIAVDAFGSDDRPVPDVEGALQAAHAYGVEIVLVGDEQRVKAELGKHTTAGLKIEIEHAAETILMEDKPVEVVRGKKNSSIHVGVRMVKDKQVDGFVSAGNTGAFLAVATVLLRNIEGVDRPAFIQTITLGPRAITVLDIGATIDNKAENLVQFAVMGDIFARKSLKLAAPRIAVLSNGTEEGKGNEVVKATADALRNISALHFVGNIEAKSLFKDFADVVVADGFVGNVLLKCLEGTTRSLIDVIRAEIKAGPLTALGGFLAKPAFGRVRKMIDPSEVGGAPFLGINGVVVKAHGSTDANGIKNAVRQAKQMVDGNIVESIRAEIQKYQVPS
jgi:phosphate acyltransferase